MSDESYFIVYTDQYGRPIESNDLRDYDGPIQWQVVGGPDVPDRAIDLHDEAREAGSAGDYDRAHRLLDEARLIAPTWPYPVYDKAWAYALEGKLEKARDAYARVNEMVPRGFFTAIPAQDILEREIRSDVPGGTYVAYVSIEWMLDPGDRRRAVEELVEQAPGLPQAWWALAEVSTDLEVRTAAVERGLALEPDADTRGMLLVQKATLLLDGGHAEEAQAVLFRVLDDPQRTFSAEALATAALVSVADPDDS